MGLLDIEFNHLANRKKVVARLVNRMQLAVDPGDHAIEGWDAGILQPVGDRAELIVSLRG